MTFDYEGCPFACMGMISYLDGIIREGLDESRGEEGEEWT